MNKPDSESRFPLKVLPVAALLVLGLCRQGEEKENTASPHAPVSAISKGVKSKTLKASSSEEALDKVVLSTTSDGSVDFNSTADLLSAFELCVEGPGDALCTNPDGPSESKCITTREGGALPVYVTLESGPQISVYVAKKSFSYALDFSNATDTAQAMSLGCQEVRKWLNTAWESLDRGSLCEKLESEQDCDVYVDALKRRGSGGYELMQASNAMGDAFEEAGIDFDQTTPYMMSGTGWSVMVEKNGYAVQLSSGLEQYLATPSEVVDAISALR